MNTTTSSEKSTTEQTQSLIDQLSELGLPVSLQEIESVTTLVKQIEKQIDGRLAGDRLDYIFLYFIVQAAARRCKSETARLLEIGVLFGGSLIVSRLALDALNDSRIIQAIDPFDGYYMHDDCGKSSKKDIITGLDISENRAIKNLKHFNLKNIELIKGLSQAEDVLEKIENESLFFLLIDGDHTFEGFKRDISNYLPKLQTDGIIAIDNYFDQFWPDVTDVLCEQKWLEYLKPVAFVNKTLFCKKLAVRSNEFSFLKEINRKAVEVFKDFDRVQSERKRLIQEQGNNNALLQFLQKHNELLMKNYSQVAEQFELSNMKSEKQFSALQDKIISLEQSLGKIVTH